MAHPYRFSHGLFSTAWASVPRGFREPACGMAGLTHPRTSAARGLFEEPAGLDALDAAGIVFLSAITLAILAVAAYLRFTGLNWDDYTHIHPDERFLTMVESGIAFPERMAEYFNTATSPLNPHNRGFGFFVYGTLPIILVRFVAESLQQTGYDQVHLVGRAASAAFDLVSVWLVYLIGARKLGAFDAL